MFKNYFNFKSFLCLLLLLIITLMTSQNILALNVDEDDIFGKTTNQSSVETSSIISNVVTEMLTHSQDWSEKLEETVKNVFKLFFTLELVVLALTGLIKRESLEDILGSMFLAALIGGLILICIINYSDWSVAIMNGLAEYTELVGYDVKDAVYHPLSKGFDIFDSITHRISIGSPFDSIVYFFSGILILICFALITIQIIYVKCEAAVAVGTAFVLLSFGGCSFFRGYVINLLKYVISVGFKLYVLYMVLGLGFAFIEEKIIIPTEISYADLGSLIIIAFLLLAMTKALPDVAAGIIHGAHVNTGDNMTRTIIQGSLLAGGTVAAARMAGLQPGNLMKAASVANSLYSSGRYGKIGMQGAMEVFNKAKAQAALDGDTSPSHVRSKLEQIRQQGMFKK